MLVKDIVFIVSFVNSYHFLIVEYFFDLMESK